MGFDYSPMASMALSQINRYGASITKVSVSRGPFDPNTGGVETTETNSTVKGVIEEYRTGEIDGKTVMRGDLKILIAGDFAVDPQDKFTVLGKSYGVVDVRHVAPGGVVLLTIVQVRR